MPHFYRYGRTPWWAGCTGYYTPKSGFGAEVSLDNTWIVNGLRINECGQLVIDAEPAYGNRKRWEGEMQFHLESGQLDELMQQINNRKANIRMQDVAADEMKEFLELIKTEYFEKRRSLSEKLNIPIEAVPTPHWWSFNDQNEPVTIFRHPI